MFSDNLSLVQYIGNILNSYKQILLITFYTGVFSLNGFKFNMF